MLKMHRIVLTVICLQGNEAVAEHQVGISRLKVRLQDSRKRYYEAGALQDRLRMR